MKDFTLQQLDSIRKSGFRPTVVICLTRNKKILLVYKRKFNLWQIPQGGVKNNEDPKVSFAREMEEELGIKSELIRQRNIVLLGSDKIEFKKSKHGSRKLVTDKGEKIKLRGKQYLIYVTDISTINLASAKTEFDKYQLLNHKEALRKTQSIYQPGKKRLSLKTIQFLKEAKFL